MVFNFFAVDGSGVLLLELSNSVNWWCAHEPCCLSGISERAES